ncbi:syntaxin-8 [Periplaneta americana]|uniref:syntaxin-8 n=1 Tax=Periplaneta americana TaxID=6978 RepID=UPI0037E958E1
MALVYLDSDPWLTEHEACEKLFREIMEQITVRSREQKTSQAYARLSSSIRLRMKQYSSEVQQLKDKLSQASASHTVTFQEAERRTRQVELLQSREKQLQQLFNDRNTTYDANRSHLIQQSGAVFADAGTTGWGIDGDEDSAIQQTQHMSVADLRQQQQRMVEDQEQGLEALSKVISRQKEIAETIGSEVDLQNEIIEDLADHMDRTDHRVRNETRQVTVIDRKDRTCWYWVVIILLFITILIIAFV